MDQDEYVPGAAGLFEQSLDSVHLGFVEIYHHKGIRAASEHEIDVGNILPQLLGHTVGHILHIGLAGHRVVFSANVVVAGDGYKRQFGGDGALEHGNRIIEEALVHFGISSITLDKVSHLENVAGVVVHQAGSALHEIPAAAGPHLSVAHEFLPVSFFPLRFRVGVAGMVDTHIGIVVVGVAKNHNGIPVLFRTFRGLQAKPRYRKAGKSGS